MRGQSASRPDRAQAKILADRKAPAQHARRAGPPQPLPSQLGQGAPGRFRRSGGVARLQLRVPGPHRLKLHFRRPPDRLGPSGLRLHRLHALPGQPERTLRASSVLRHQPARPPPDRREGPPTSPSKDGGRLALLRRAAQKIDLGVPPYGKKAGNKAGY
jgi:hypothetical protein